MAYRRGKSNAADTHRKLTATAWRWRLELLMTAVVFLSAQQLQGVVGPGAAFAIVAGVVAVLLAIAPVRRTILHALAVARTRRWFGDAQARARVSLPHGRPAVVRDFRETPSGLALKVKLARGQSVGDFSDVDRLARALSSRRRPVRAVRVVRTPGRADVLTVMVVTRDPFEDYVPDPKSGKPVLRPLPWPDRATDRLSGWDPIQMGVDVDGNPVTITLFEHNLLVGGIPGAGKSVALSVVAAHCALSPDVRLWLFDGKRVEFKAWTPCAHRLVVGPDRSRAIQVLKELQAEVDRRQVFLDSAGPGGRAARKLTPEHGLPLEVLMIDELATYVVGTDDASKKQAKQISDMLADIVRLGRALGVVAVLATQKPEGTVVDTTLRDLVDTRLAFRCLTPPASDTILGQGRASGGADASKIPPPQKGVGIMLSDVDEPFLERGYFLSDEDLSDIAGRAARKHVDTFLDETLNVGDPA